MERLCWLNMEHNSSGCLQKRLNPTETPTLPNLPIPHIQTQIDQFGRMGKIHRISLQLAEILTERS